MVASQPPKAPNAIREELERAASLISLQPEIGARARNISLPGVRRLHLSRVRHYVYYRVVTDPERIELLPSGTRVAGKSLRSNVHFQLVAMRRGDRRLTND